MIEATFTRQVGDVTVKIDISPTDTFHVVSMKPIKYEFGLQEDAPDLESVSVLYNKCEIVCRYLTDGGSDLFDIILNDLGTGEAFVDIIISPVAGGNDWKWRFEISREDLVIDEEERTVKLNLRPHADDDWNDDGTLGSASIETIIDNYYDGKPEEEIYRFKPGINAPAGDQGAPLLSFGQFINETFNTRFLNTTTVIEASMNAVGVLNQYMDGDNEYFIVVNRQTGSTLDSPPFALLKDVAAIEGTLFGSAFDQNFWIHKLSTSQTPITLGAHNIRNLKYALSFVQYNIMTTQVKVTNTAGRYRASANGFTDPPLSYSAGKRIDLILDPLKDYNDSVFFAKGTKLVGSEEVENTYDDFSTATIEQTIINNGLDAWRTSLNKPVRVEFVARGMDALKPWEPFQFDTSVPSRYQNRVFRAHSLSYSIEDDNVTVKGYQIGT